MPLADATPLDTSVLGILYAVVTVLAWGTWLAPSQQIPLRRQEVRMFHVTATNFAIALVVAAMRGFGAVNWREFGAPFIGGLVWAVSGLCAFTASSRLGIAKAFGIWAPLNILVSLTCGWLFFEEFRELSVSQVLLLSCCVVVILAGVLMIIFSKPPEADSSAARSQSAGYLAAVGAGVLWGIYFLPVKASGASLWTAAFPLSAGMLCGSGILLALSRASLRLNQAAHRARLVATGVLWTIGNFGMLLLVDTLGAGRGYTISQLAVVVNALAGIYILREPAPGTRAARWTLAGCCIATAGAILLGQIR